jgi:hypothetical protein
MLTLLTLSGALSACGGDKTNDGGASGTAGEGGAGANDDKAGKGGTGSPTSAGSGGSSGTNSSSASQDIKPVAWQQLAWVNGDHVLVAGNFATGVNYASRSWPGTVEFDLDGELLRSSYFAETAATPLLQSMKVGSSGNIFVSGSTAAPIGDQAQSQTRDLFVAKLDAAGALLWAEQFDDPEDTITAGDARVIGVDDDDNAHVLHQTQTLGAATLIKYGSDGEQLWSTPVDFVAQYAAAYPDAGTDFLLGRAHAAFEPSGASQVFANLTVLSLKGTGPTHTHVWLMQRFDSEGNAVWSTIVDDDECGIGGSLVAAVGTSPEDGSIYAMGTCLTKLNDAGERLWSLDLGDYAGVYSVASNMDAAITHFGVALPTGGGVYVFGPANGPPTQVDSIARGFDADGKQLWRKDMVGFNGRELTYDPTGDRLLFLAFEQSASTGTVAQVLEGRDQSLRTLRLGQ